MSQEVVTLVVFTGFAVLFLKEKLARQDLPVARYVAIAETCRRAVPFGSQVSDIPTYGELRIGSLL
jgi:hypothetical protein